MVSEQFSASAARPFELAASPASANLLSIADAIAETLVLGAESSPALGEDRTDLPRRPVAKCAACGARTYASVKAHRPLFPD